MILLLLAQLAAPVPAPSPTPPAKPEKIVCRYVTPPNSRLGQRTCKTVSQWKGDDISPDARRRIDDAVVRRGTSG